MNLLKFKLAAERKQEAYQAKRWVYTQQCLQEFKEWQARLKAQLAQAEEQQQDRHDGEGEQDAIEHSRSSLPARTPEAPA